jgi:hypothetical protein
MADVAGLQALIERSVRTARPTVAKSAAFPGRKMRASELVEFIRSTRLITMATIGPAGQPHIASVHTELDGATPRLVVYEDTVRRKDLARDSPVTFTTWKEDVVAIFYGRAAEVLGRLRSTSRHARRPFPPPSRLTGSGATGGRSRPPYTFCGLEALQNVVKYPGAAHAIVRLKETDSAVEFSVADDRTGFDPETMLCGAALRTSRTSWRPSTGRSRWDPSRAKEQSSLIASRPVELCYTSAGGT